MIFNFGKYLGKKIEDVLNDDPSYCIWISETFNPKNKKQADIKEAINKLLDDDTRKDYKRSFVPIPPTTIVQYGQVIAGLGNAINGLGDTDLSNELAIELLKLTKIFISYREYHEITTSQENHETL